MRRRPTQRERYILADLVRHRRMELRYSQQKIADCLGCSLHWMNDIEQGKVDPTGSKIVEYDASLFHRYGVN